MAQQQNVRTGTLRKYLSGPDAERFRLSTKDRAFLKDLAKTQIVALDDAKAFHYGDRPRFAEKRLDKLCDVGLLKKVEVTQPGKGTFMAYHFKEPKAAKLFRGKVPAIGRKRNALHEVITSKLYFAEGRPSSWTLESDFDKDTKKLFKLSSGVKSGTGRGSVLPDAIYRSSRGTLVVVEADSGQYNQKQIQSKQAMWGDFEQVWGQPSKAAARVHDSKVHKF